MRDRWYWMKYKKIIIVIVVLVILLSFTTGIVEARKSNKRVKPEKIKPDKVKPDKVKPEKFQSLDLFEKDPDTWEIVNRGAWGRLRFNPSGEEFQFIFNGHRLLPDTIYSLIYYPDPWPGYGLVVIGEGLSDEYGNILIKGSQNTGDLPRTFDENYPDGAKIWLVLSLDVDYESQYMVGWNPAEYLFENVLFHHYYHQMPKNAYLAYQL